MIFFSTKNVAKEMSKEMPVKHTHTEKFRGCILWSRRIGNILLSYNGYLISCNFRTISVESGYSVHHQHFDINSINRTPDTSTSTLCIQDQEAEFSIAVNQLNELDLTIRLQIKKESLEGYSK